MRRTEFEAMTTDKTNNNNGLRSPASHASGDLEEPYTFSTPPITLQSLRDDPKETLRRSSIFWETMFCITLGILIAFVPHALFKVRERPIPYQETAAGDVMLDLTKDQLLEDETVPVVTGVIVVGLIPFLIQVALSLFFGESNDGHFTLSVFAIANGITQLVTDIVKNYVGYLRPNFYELCGFDSETISCQNEDSGDSRKSFPSGHSGLTFCTMTLLTFYLMRIFGVDGLLYREQGPGGVPIRAQPRALHRINSVFCLLPMLIAVFVAVSRIADNYHHPADVVGGAVLGVGCAMVINNIWFYSIPIRD